MNREFLLFVLTLFFTFVCNLMIFDNSLINILIYFYFIFKLVFDFTMDLYSCTLFILSAIFA